jgi:hypothetical protein
MKASNIRTSAAMKTEKPNALIRAGVRDRAVDSGVRRDEELRFAQARPRHAARRGAATQGLAQTFGHPPAFLSWATASR